MVARAPGSGRGALRRHREAPCDATRGDRHRRLHRARRPAARRGGDPARCTGGRARRRLPASSGSLAGPGSLAYLLARLSRRTIRNPSAASSPFRAPVLERRPAGGPFALDGLRAPARAARPGVRSRTVRGEPRANADSTDAATSAGRSAGRGAGRRWCGAPGPATRGRRARTARSAQRETVAESMAGAQVEDRAGRYAAAAAVLGPAWEHIVSALGPLLARELFRHATAEVAARPAPGRTGRGRGGAGDAAGPVRRAHSRSSRWSARSGRRPLWRTRAQRDAHGALVDGRIELARSAGPWWALHGLAIVSERPPRAPARRQGTAARRGRAGDRVPRRHAALGMARRPRGPQSVIEDPETITIEAIDGERNTEVRRVLIERYGEERFIRGAGAELVAEDETGRLWRRGGLGSRAGAGSSPTSRSSWWRSATRPPSRTVRGRPTSSASRRRCRPRRRQWRGRSGSGRWSTSRRWRPSDGAGRSRPPESPTSACDRLLSQRQPMMTTAREPRGEREPPPPPQRHPGCGPIKSARESRLDDGAATGLASHQARCPGRVR